ncbi:TonB-dependent receptor [Ferrovibrio sp.]|uniref:TonB-dependent receptor n=1 Tax=Ferrovibrio sp. TaxID=1917215 RepID=UPI00351685F7
MTASSASSTIEHPAPSAALQPAPLPTVGRLRLPRVRPAMLASAVTAGLGVVSLPAAAQQAASPAPATLPAIAVEGQKPAETGEGYKAEESASPKFTAPLLDTPKSVTVITREVMEDRGVTSLKDVLRTTPGISLGSGEGGTAIGDRPFIRGFDALTDTFVDGIRDGGAQSRETFNLEQVEVIKGPGSAYTGRGSTGGSLNLVSKTAKAEDFNEGSVTLGTDLTKRATVDVNRMIDSNIAFRINAVAHDAEVAGRDEVEVQRFGFAPTVTFGLAKPTKLTLSYYHLQTDDIPDYGHPFDPRTGKPVGVDRDNFYGLTSRDFQKTYYDGATAQIEHELTDSATLRNTTRYSYSENDYIVTKPNASLTQILAGEMSRESRSRNADSITVANVTDVTGDFEAGGYKNTYVAGLEVSWEQSKNRGYTLNPATITGVSLYNPNPGDGYSGSIGPSTSFAHVETTTMALYAMDTIELTPEWEVNLGLRLDRYDSDANGVNNSGAYTAKTTDAFLNYQAGVVYKPLPNGSIYVAYATSSNPAGGAAGEGGDAGNPSAATQDLSPEENRSYEIGTKWDMFNKALSLTGAIFRTEKTNARVSVGSGVQQNVGEERVDGFEIGVSGNITPDWQIFGGYTFLKSEIVDDGPSSSNDGKEFPFIAPHNISLWTTYNIDTAWKIGGGAIYTARRFANTANTYELPSYWRLDAMAAYKVSEQVEVQLNVQNLLDETYYDATHAGQFANVAPGRTALLTTNFKF